MDVAGGRSLHSGAVPRIGGIAMAIATAIALAGWALAQPELAVGTPPLLAAAALVLLSILDDWRSLPVLPRLLGHLAAAVVAVLAFELPPVTAALAVLAIVWMTNLYNFMDGANGLAGGMALIGFGTYGLAALATEPTLAAVCLMVAAAAAGFLPFNAVRARVFMGDAGSVPLGFLAGALGVAGWRAGVWPAWFPGLVFSPFIADATVTLVRRMANGERFWQAHRSHYYQRLVQMGWSHGRLALAAYGVMLSAAACSLLIRHQSAGLAGGVLLTWAITYFVAFRWVDRRWYGKVSSPLSRE